MKRQRKGISHNRKFERGMALVETMVAVAILLIMAAGVMGLAGVALTTTENQGHLAARTAEYAQDKMEQLLALTYCDGTTDTTVFPAATVAGTAGLAGCTNPGNNPPTASTGGSLTTATTYFVDYLDASGNLVGSAGNYEYTRMWQITIPAGSTATSGLKQITVTAQARRGIGGLRGILPQSTVTALKSYPF